MSGRRSFLLSSIVTLLASACASHDDSLSTSVDEIRAGHGIGNRTFIGLDVLVTDEQGAPVACDAGSLAVHVEVSEVGTNGPWLAVPTDFQQTRCATSGGEFAMVVDNSGSELPHLEELQAATMRAADTVLASGGSVSLVRVSTESNTVLPLSADQAAVASAIGSLHISNGWTALWDGVRLGNETLGGAPLASTEMFDDLDAFCGANRPRGVLVFTDGQDNNSSDEHATADYPGDGLDTRFDDLLGLNVGGVRTPIYTIGMGRDPDHARLAELADRSGGRHFAIDQGDDVGTLFEHVASYFGASHRVCARLPEPACGTLYARVTWTWNDGVREVSGEKLETIDLGCPSTPSGRNATILLTMQGSGLPASTAEQLAANLVSWTSPVPDPEVLVVLDDNHHDEDTNDANFVRDLLAARGYHATYLAEPEGGLSPADVAGYDVVWFSNPGYPPDDYRTIETLLGVIGAGGGVVLQGDDMTQSWGNAWSMTPLTGLDFVDNGTTACNRTIDNNATNDHYEVRFEASTHPVLDGIGNVTLLYGNDIDNSTPEANATVYAHASVAGTSSCGMRSVLTVADHAVP